MIKKTTLLLTAALLTTNAHASNNNIDAGNNPEGDSKALTFFSLPNDIIRIIAPNPQHNSLLLEEFLDRELVQRHKEKHGYRLQLADFSGTSYPTNLTPVTVFNFINNLGDLPYGADGSYIGFRRVENGGRLSELVEKFGNTGNWGEERTLFRNLHTQYREQINNSGLVTFLKLRLVCKSWRNALDKHPNSPLMAIFQNRLFSHDEISDSTLYGIGDWRVHGIRGLSLNKTSVNMFGNLLVARLYPNLSKLELIDCDMPVLKSSYCDLATLKELVVQNHGNGKGVKSLNPLLRGLTQLDTLALGGHQLSSVNFVDTEMPGLTVLNLCATGDVLRNISWSVDDLRVFPNLKVLNLSNTTEDNSANSTTSFIIKLMKTREKSETLSDVAIIVDDKNEVK